MFALTTKSPAGIAFGSVSLTAVMRDELQIVHDPRDMNDRS